MDSKTLYLRTCNKDGTSYNGFKWPLEVGAEVEAPDWNTKPKCGGGLHGLPWGVGDGWLLDWTRDAIAVIFSAVGGDVIDINGKKSKVKRARIEAIFQSVPEAAAYLQEHDSEVRPIVGATVTVAAGGRAIAGYKGQAMAGKGGQAIVGHYGRATVNNGGRATAGNEGQATAGKYGQAIAGSYGQAMAGNHGQATVGDEGQATAGDEGQAMTGERGTAAVGYYGQATAGAEGIISITYTDGKRLRMAIGYIGETKDANGDVLRPNTPYCLNNDGRFVVAECEKGA